MKTNSSLGQKIVEDVLEFSKKADQRRNKLLPSVRDEYDLLALFRLFVLIPVCLSVLLMLGNLYFEQVDSWALAKNVQETNIFFRHISLEVLNLFTYLFNSQSSRYMIAPLLAIVFVILSGAAYVQDVFMLEHFRDALHYVISALFALRYPELTIDKGKKQIGLGEINLLDKIGGPGFADIKPVHAVMFRALRAPSKIIFNEKYFLSYFETIGQIAILDEQQGHLEQLFTITKDGIQVVVRNIEYRFKINVDDSQQDQKLSQNFSYSYSEDSFRKIAYNLTVTEDGPRSWNETVEKKVTGAIKDFVNSHDIDFLTAPKQKDQDPRGNLRYELFNQKVRCALKNVGAELLWVDFGHIDIVEPTVDESRINLWAQEWIGNSEALRAYGEATRQAYQELGRAEAQAEMLMSIAHALEDLPESMDTTQNLQKIFLLKTAQILDAVNQNPGEKKSQ